MALGQMEWKTLSVKQVCGVCSDALQWEQSKMGVRKICEQYLVRDLSKNCSTLDGIETSVRTNHSMVVWHGDKNCRTHTRTHTYTK